MHIEELAHSQGPAAPDQPRAQGVQPPPRGAYRTRDRPLPLGQLHCAQRAIRREHAVCVAQDIPDLRLGQQIEHVGRDKPIERAVRARLVGGTVGPSDDSTIPPASEPLLRELRHRRADVDRRSTCSRRTGTWRATSTAWSTIRTTSAWGCSKHPRDARCPRRRGSYHFDPKGGPLLAGGGQRDACRRGRDARRPWRASRRHVGARAAQASAGAREVLGG